jgi:hypothetical protein
MSLPAYYPLSFQTAYQNQTNYTNPNGPPATIETPDSAHEGPPESTDSGKTRQCTVRGCTKMISSESGNKMCETCRGRHRTYATTKRAKRKMEKAAVASQSFGHCHGEQRAAIWIAVNPSPNSVVAPRVPTPFQRKINSTGGKPLGVSGHLCIKI